MRVPVPIVANTVDGRQIFYRDRKRYWWWLSVLSPGVPAIAVGLFVATGGAIWTALMPLVIYYLLIPLVDWAVGEDFDNPPEEVVAQLESDNYYRALLFLSLPVFFTSFFAVAWLVGTHPLPFWVFLALTLGAGAASGSGLTVGHELGHKHPRLDRAGAKLICALTGYAHFCIEHNRGHHSEVATPEDIASARLGENVWRFALRELPGALKRGWYWEKRRLAAKGFGFWTWHNDLLQGYAITLLIATILLAAFGWIMIPFLIIHHISGWLQLTFANYVEHYGLKRDRRADGRYAPCEPRHSWNTNHIISNLMLFHLQRHSDHHANPLRPYQALRDFKDLPRLPSGYPGCFVLAAIPPLWFHIMDRKVLDWAGGRLDATNLLPTAADHYQTRFATV